MPCNMDKKDMKKTATKKTPSAAQLKARENFVKMVKEKAAKKK